jgi:hypothetical protein
LLGKVRLVADYKLLLSMLRKRCWLAGVSFDTGGLNIKSAMLDMKKDMGGAAQTLGLALLVMQVQLDPFGDRL